MLVLADPLCLHKAKNALYLKWMTMVSFMPLILINFYFMPVFYRSMMLRFMALILFHEKRPEDRPEYLGERYLSHEALHVRMPNGRYRGQKPSTLVNTNTPPNISNTIPKVPVTVPVTYNAANTTAIITRMILSAEPMFFFMFEGFGL